MSTQNQQKQDSSVGPTYEQIKTRWNNMVPIYITMDSAPQTFYYTLTNLLKLNEAKNILEIACGAGKLIPQVMDLKKPETFYFATDISEEMLKYSRTRLQRHFQKYQSKLTLDQYLKKQNFEFGLANGEEKIPKQIKFDRIICNLVLMLTQDPKKMLKNLYESAEEGCLLGLTVWGDRNKNNVFSLVEDISKENGVTPPNARSNFFLYEKIQDLTLECGWQKVLAWQQTAMFPVIQFSEQKMHPFIQKQILHRLPKQLHAQFLSKIDEYVNIKKCGLNFGCKLMIVRKISKKQ